MFTYSGHIHSTGGQEVPSPAIVLTPDVSLVLYQAATMTCSFENVTLPNNMNATWLWSNNQGTDCCVGQGTSGTLVVNVTSNCQSQYYCTPQNSYGHGQNGTVALNISGINTRFTMSLYTKEQLTCVEIPLVIRK